MAASQAVAADQTVQVMLDVIGAQVDRAASFSFNAAFTGKGLAPPALVKIRTEFGNRKRGRSPANSAQRAEMPAPGLASIGHRQKGSAYGDGQYQIGCSGRPIRHIGDDFDPDYESKQKDREIDPIFFDTFGYRQIDTDSFTLQENPEAGEWADAAPHPPYEKPGENYRGPEQSPGQEDREISIGVLGPEKT